MSDPMGRETDPPTPCAKCGEIHDPNRCQGHRRNGDQCTRPPGWGIPGVHHGNCKHHFGATPNGRVHAERLRVETEIAETLARYELAEGADDPLEQLLAALRTAGAMRRIFAELVGTLGGGATRAYVEVADDGKGSPTYVPAEPMGIVGPDHKGDGKPHVYVTELRAWTVEAARVAKLALDANVDERSVRIAERYADGLGQVVQAVAAAVIGAFVERGAGDELVRGVQAVLGGLIRGAIEASGVIDVEGIEGAG